MSEFDTGLPSTRQLQDCIKDEKEIEIKLLTGDLLMGKLRWQDQECLCILTEAEQPAIIIWRQAIAYIKPLL
ncbi:Hfq-related RNA-binding protein [Lyngbya aestuarii]|uniref:Hfq-related RNA-binding protein n=1 Tax=Lyngbya aestuarii TaxID=118322 RepID=UPI00403D5996